MYLVNDQKSVWARATGAGDFLEVKSSSSVVGRRFWNGKKSILQRQNLQQYDSKLHAI